MLGKTLPALVATAALGLLAFLVYQSRPVSVAEHAGQARTVDLIRQSAEDVRTLGQVLKAARRELRVPGLATQSISERLREQRAGVEENIIARGTSDGHDSIAVSLEEYSRSLARVQAHVADFSESQAEFARAVAGLREQSGAVIQKLRSRGSESVAQDLFALVSQTLDYARSDRGLTTDLLVGRLSALRADDGLLASQSTAVSDLLIQIETVLSNRDVADTALGALLAETFLESASRLAGASEAGYRMRLDRVERSRLLLVVYCALLLVGVGFVLYRLNLSYRRINDANEELADANEGLEQRVGERTAELESAYENLKESQVQLVQAEKMSSLGQLVAGISHEINTPLLYLQSNASLINERLELLGEFIQRADSVLCMQPRQGESGREFSGRFLQALKQLKRVLLREELSVVISEATELMRDSNDGLRDLTEMAQSLKDFSRLDRAPMDQFNVNEGLEKTLLIARHALRHKSKVVREFGELPPVFCCPSQINQVFLNLVTNAAQSIESEGTIRITTRCTDDEQVAIAIQDTGCGIPEEVLGSIRDPFFTTKEVGKGTGLGLSIVDRIIREHGGQLHVESTVGKGSTFTVVLPVRGAVAAESDNPRPAAESGAQAAAEPGIAEETSPARAVAS